MLICFACDFGLHHHAFMFMVLNFDGPWPLVKLFFFFIVAAAIMERQILLCKYDWRAANFVKNETT